MFKNVSLVTLLSMAAQVIGLLRMVIVAFIYGLSADIDAYYLALALPSLLAVVFSNWLQLTFVGQYATLINQPDASHAAHFKYAMLTLVAAAASAICVAGFVFPQAPFDLLLNNPDETVGVAFRYLILMLLPIAVADFMGQTLNAHGRFAMAASAPLVNAAVSILTLWYWQDLGLTWLSDTAIAPLVGSLLIGSLVQLLIISAPFMAISTMATSTWQFRFSAAIKAELVTVAGLTAYIVPAIALSNAMLSVLQFSVAQLGSGSVTAMSFANRINSSVAQLVVIGLSTVLLPQFAALIARGETHITFHLFRRLSRGAVVVGMGLCVAAYLFAEPLIRLLLVRGAFGAAEAQLTAQLFFVLCLSLPCLALGTFIARYFSAQRRADLLLVSGMLGFCAVLTVAMIGVAEHNLLIIAAAPATAYTLTLLFWMHRLTKQFEVIHMLKDIAQAGLRTSLIVALAALADHLLTTHLPIADETLGLGLRTATFLLIIAILVFVSGTMKWLMEPPPPAKAKT